MKHRELTKGELEFRRYYARFHPDRFKEYVENYNSTL